MKEGISVTWVNDLVASFPWRPFSGRHSSLYQCLSPFCTICSRTPQSSETKKELWFRIGSSKFIVAHTKLIFNNVQNTSVWDTLKILFTTVIFGTTKKKLLKSSSIFSDLIAHDKNKKSLLDTEIGQRRHLAKSFTLSVTKRPFFTNLEWFLLNSNVKKLYLVSRLATTLTFLFHQLAAERYA